jgi:hypothetical protein
MLMGSSSKIQYIESDFNIFYDDGLLNDVKYEKILGITIDNCVSWCLQINNIVSKISSRLRFKFVVSPPYSTTIIKQW